MRSEARPLAFDNMSRPIRSLPFLLFIVSGAWGLVYEVTWARYLSLFLGNTTLAHMCVLAGFMGGLALGSLVLGAMTARMRRPLAAYGYLEIGIGVYAMLYPFLIKPLQSLALAASSGLEFGSPLLLTVKLTVSMLALILPTFLMGGTFPVLMKHFKPETTEKEDKSEWLYLANCAGAVGGTLLAGFMLVPWLGLSMTLWSVGLANLAIGFLAAALGLATETAAQTAGDEHEEVPVTKGKRHNLLLPVYAAIGVSGATAMVYELVWIRMFAVTLGSSTYSFTLMLAAFITGIALGSLAVGLIKELRSKPVFWFGVSELAIALAIVVSMPLYQRLPWVFWKWSSLLRRSVETLGVHNLIKYSLCFVVMLVPTMFFGMTLPLAIKAVTRRDEAIGRDSGFVYGANTIGTLVGALLTGLVLIPLTGLRTSLHIALIANLAAAVLILMYSDMRARRLIAALGCVAVVAILVINPAWHPVTLMRGTFRMRSAAPPTWDAYLASLADAKVLFAAEDGGENVAVIEAPVGPGRVVDRILTINGKPDGTAWADMATQKLVAQIPLTFRPGSENVLVIGLGTGGSAGAALTHPGVRVDCVEISPAVARAVRYFDDVNHRVRKNPRFNLIIEDGRTLTAVTRKKYDVIVSEPTNPWIAGVGSLFTVEYFRSLDRILEPDGLAVVWFQAYEMSDALAAMIVRSVRRVFPYIYIFEGGTNDYIMLASREPMKPDFKAMEREMQIESVRADFDLISMDSLAGLLSRQVLSAKGAEEFAGEGMVNTDDLPLLEYQAPVAHYTDTVAGSLKEVDERRWRSSDLFIAGYLKARGLDQTVFRSLVRTYSDPRMTDPDLLLALLKYYVSVWPDDPVILQRYAQFIAATQPANAMRAAELATQLNPSAEGYELQSDILFSELLRRQSAFTPQDFRPVLALLDKAIKLDPKDPELQRKRRRILVVIQQG